MSLIAQGENLFNKGNVGVEGRQIKRQLLILIDVCLVWLV